MLFYETLFIRLVKAFQNYGGVFWCRLDEESENLCAEDARMAHANKTDAGHSHGDERRQDAYSSLNSRAGSVLGLSYGDTVRVETSCRCVWRR